MACSSKTGRSAPLRSTRNSLEDDSSTSVPRPPTIKRHLPIHHVCHLADLAEELPHLLA